jgi:hypothetical protein
LIMMVASKLIGCFDNFYCYKRAAWNCLNLQN